MYYKEFHIESILNEPRPAPRIGNSTDAYKLLIKDWPEVEVCERFRIILLNEVRDVLGIKTLSVGGTLTSIVDQKITLKYITDTLATGAIIAHNHPSGNLEPSDSDRKVTRMLYFLFKIAQVQLVDHIICSNKGHYSFLDNDQIPTLEIQEIHDELEYLFG